MTKSFDLIRVAAFALTAMVIAVSLNGLVDVGARLHDVFCMGHGWFS